MILQFLVQSEEGFRKRAKMVNNILDHTSKHDQDIKAKLKIIDKEGEEFGQKIKQKSKMIQATTQLTPEIQPYYKLTGWKSNRLVRNPTNKKNLKN